MLLALALIAACSDDASPAATTLADLIFVGGDIITMTDAEPRAEALAVKDGRILAVGDRALVEKHKGGATRVVDLGDRTLCPAFIDCHSHFSNALQVVNWVNVSAPPVGGIEDIPGIVAALKKHVDERKPGKGEWIIGYGLDSGLLKEGRDPTVDDLDPHFPDNPVMLIHVSNHGAVLNSKGLAKFKIDASTKTPPGGIIVRKPGGNEPAGLLMETAFLPLFMEMPKPSEEELLSRLGAVQTEYAKNGYATAQEGATVLADLDLLRKAAAQGKLLIDVVSYVMITDAVKVISDKNYTFGEYSGRFRLAGVKNFIDGSPQGRTAYFTKAYLTGGPADQKNWRGEPTMTPGMFNKFIKLTLDAGVQVSVHANGDAAIDMVLAAFKECGVTREQDLRPIVIHSQFVRPEQLDAYVEYGVVPSFFTNHAFFWGDAHIENLGKKRASFLSPLAAAKQKGLRFTNHTDYTVTPLDPMMTIWTAVTRKTRTGVVLGPEQRVSAMDALKALTVNAAYQYREEKTKGTLELGKLADLVILSANPTTVEPDAIRNITVVETFKDGKSIYTAK